MADDVTRRNTASGRHGVDAEHGVPNDAGAGRGERPSVLMTAFHFPPMKGSSGVHRTLGFARHLRACAWQPVILTAGRSAYPVIDEREMRLVPEGVTIERGVALDAARHLSLAGRYPDFLAVPDRWSSWALGGFIAGRAAIRRHRPRLIWSTYPIATAHVVAGRLARAMKLPWIADFRDPMVERNPRTGEYAPASPALRKSRLRIERLCVEHADALVFCTEGARRICIERYPDARTDHWHVISNGFEEAHFAELATRTPVRRTGPVTLLHSGTVYLTPDRDPTPFFRAVAACKQRGVISGARLRILLRAPGNAETLGASIAAHGIDDIVHIESSLPYLDALAEMQAVDGLLLFQGYTSNPAIPAKLYEYLRAGRPILALVDGDGESAALLRRLGTGRLAPIEDADGIERELSEFLADLATGKSAALPGETIRRYSRAALTAELADLFNAISGRNAGPAGG